MGRRIFAAVARTTRSEPGEPSIFPFERGDQWIVAGSRWAPDPVQGPDLAGASTWAGLSLLLERIVNPA